MDYTPILKLALPPFDDVPWDEAVNGDFSILDAAVGRFFGVANLVGVWKNATAYTVGQSVVDDSDSSMWTCNVTHTSAAVPTVFSTDRTNNPTYWINIVSTAHDYALAAQSSANAAASSASDAASSASDAANSASVVSGALPLSGGTMTGLVILSGDPTNVRGAATKQYVDARVGGTGFLPTTGGTLTGPLTLSGNPATALQAAPKQYVDLRVLKSGDTMTGQLTTITPTAGGHATNKTYVDNKVSTTVAGYLPLTGGTVTGALTSNGVILSNTVGKLQAQVPTGQASLGLWHLGAATNIGLWAPGGNTIFVGAMDGNNTPTQVFANITNSGQSWLSDGSMSFVATGNFRSVQFSPNWAWQWDGTNGNFGWATPSGMMWNLRPSDNFAFNNIGAVGGVGAYVNLSDERTKSGMQPISYGMTTVRQIDAVEFTREGKDTLELGFSAQHVQAVVPEAVRPFSDPVDPDPLLGIMDGALLAVAWNAIKELDARLSAMELR
jgi:Chaperone of endosialidase